MLHSQTHLRSRPISAGQLRAFEAVARHLNFRAASEELALTQSAVSRQIQALEDDVGVSLFHRHTRAVELTSAGGVLLRAVSPSLDRIDGAVRQIRQSAGRKSVALTTFASFASMWLITAVISPWLLKSGPRLKKPDDLANFTLIEAGDAHHTHLEWLTWRRWFDEHAAPKLEAKRWLYFNYAYQMVQAALTGQGVVLARLPLIAESLASGDLVEPLPDMRLDSPMAYWLVVGPRSMVRPEVAAFCEWLKVQSALTREAIGDVPDPDTVDNID